MIDRTVYRVIIVVLHSVHVGINIVAGMIILSAPVVNQCFVLLVLNLILSMMHAAVDIAATTIALDALEDRIVLVV